MKLKVQGLSDPGDPAFPTAYVSIENGRLMVDCPDPAVVDELVDTLANRYFIQGRGFPTFEKDSSTGAFRSNPADGRLILQGFVDLNAPPDEILRAISDNFRVGEQYQVDEVPD